RLQQKQRRQRDSDGNGAPRQGAPRQGGKRQRRARQRGQQVIVPAAPGEEVVEDDRRAGQERQRQRPPFDQRPDHGNRGDQKERLREQHPPGLVIDRVVVEDGGNGLVKEAALNGGGQDQEVQRVQRAGGGESPQLGRQPPLLQEQPGFDGETDGDQGRLQAGAQAGRAAQGDGSPARSRFVP